MPRNTTVLTVAIFFNVITTSVAYGLTKTSTRNTSLAVCGGEDVKIPSTWVGKCTNPIPSLTTPWGTIKESNGKIIYTKMWKVNKVQVKDGGMYINHLSCDEGKKEI